MQCGAFADTPEDRGLCRRCLEQVPRLDRHAVCEKCGYPLPVAGIAGCCPICAETDFPFDLARAAGPYEPLLREWIHRYKFDRQTGLHLPLGRLLAAEYHRTMAGLDFECVTWVPLHPGRLRERGFDQARLLAKTVAGAAGRPLRRLLKRTRATAAQSSLPLTGRNANVRGAFAPTRACAGLGGALIVDDIFTTGATLGECARALLAGGVERVYVLTLARVVLN